MLPTTLATDPFHTDPELVQSTTYTSTESSTTTSTDIELVSAGAGEPFTFGVSGQGITDTEQSASTVDTCSSGSMTDGENESDGLKLVHSQYSDSDILELYDVPASSGDTELPLYDGASMTVY